jgi:two-component system, cell cycle response regulator DivK
VEVAARETNLQFDGTMSAPPPHVLLVEDDRDTREMYSEYLSYSGLRVSEAPSGRRALETVRAHRPDIVVTDLAMPEMDGRELSHRLRSDRRTSDLPIIAVSGQLAPGEKMADADLVLEKPCEPDRLLHAIHDVLHRPHQ